MRPSSAAKMCWGGASSPSPTQYAPHSLAAPPPTALRSIARQPTAMHSACLWERRSRKTIAGPNAPRSAVPSQRAHTLRTSLGECSESRHYNNEIVARLWTSHARALDRCVRPRNQRGAYRTGYRAAQTGVCPHRHYRAGNDRDDLRSFRHSVWSREPRLADRRERIVLGAEATRVWGNSAWVRREHRTRSTARGMLRRVHHRWATVAIPRGRQRPCDR